VTISVVLSRRGTLVAATASCVPAVGRIVPHVRAGLGALVTQAEGDPTVADHVFAALHDGVPPDHAVAGAVRRIGRAPNRQVAFVTSSGHSSVHDGDGLVAWAGSRAGPGYVVSGNLLASARVLDAAATALEEAVPEEIPTEAALGALAAAELAGGDARGRMSAALVAHGDGLHTEARHAFGVEVRIDYATDPLAALADAVRAQAGRSAVDTLLADPTPPGLEAAVDVARRLAAVGPDASAAVLYCRRMLDERLGARATARALAGEIVADRPGPAANPLTIERMWSTPEPTET